MPWVLDDGGREIAGFKGLTGDCVVRAAAIVTQRPYKELYDLLNELAGRERPRKGRKRSSARTGVKKTTTRKFMAELGLTWHPCMQIGSGCKVHLVKEEIPMGQLVVSVSKHVTAVIDRVIHDIHDPQRSTLCFGGKTLLRVAHRCVYGHYVS